ncbi:MAG: LytR family transcriptional regulator [Chloroflexi bacterium]|nr:MAG: LytR family transcriptional regulator [Chloroflexota bacterium]
MKLIGGGSFRGRTGLAGSGLWIAWGVVAGVGGALWLGRAGSAPLPARATTVAVQASATPPATAAGVVVADATVLPATAQPTALPTGFFILEPGATPMPTPVLPEAPPFPENCSGPGQMNLLLMGVDGRTADFNTFGRADTLMLLAIDFGMPAAHLLSIARDLWITVPGYASYLPVEGRVNLGYALGDKYGYPGGNPAFQVFTVSQALGVRVDRYAVVNFTAFEKIIDALGGLDVTMQVALRDPLYPLGPDNTMVLEIPAGDVHLDGRTALMYARTRHADSDFGRMRRQQKILMAAREKLLSPAVIFAVPALLQFAFTAVHSDLSLEEIGLLGCALPRIGGAGITQHLMDYTMTHAYKTRGGAEVLVGDPAGMAPVLALFGAAP